MKIYFAPMEGMFCGGQAATREELARWYLFLYNGWTERIHATLALGRIKKLMTWPYEGIIRRIRLLHRAKTVEKCHGCCAVE